MNTPIWNSSKTEHYIFHYLPNSYAQQELGHIMELQEHCYGSIINTLNLTGLHFPIEYFLYESPESVGECYSKYHPDEPVEPCNGFAHQPNQIHAVYNQNIQCIGYHEDVHIIAAHHLGYPSSHFIREGLAMYFDDLWWGLPNKLWLKLFITREEYPGLSNLFDNEQFEELPSRITYPTSGAFTEFIIRRYGQSTFCELYRKMECLPIETSILSVLGVELQKLDSEFIKFIRFLDYSPALYQIALERAQ
jgi:hypothetical protein